MQARGKREKSGRERNDRTAVEEEFGSGKRDVDSALSNTSTGDDVAHQRRGESPQVLTTAMICF